MDRQSPLPADGSLDRASVRKSFEQYAAVAELLRYVYELKGKTLPDLSQAA